MERDFEKEVLGERDGIVKKTCMEIYEKEREGLKDVYTYAKRRQLSS